MAIVGALHRSGVPIVAGTDQAVPGHSLHREIELYVQAGFTPMEAIQAATLVPARVMGMEKESGTVEKGKRADLILINGNPLEDIHNTRNVEYVITNGTHVSHRGILAERGIQAVSKRPWSYEQQAGKGPANGLRHSRLYASLPPYGDAQFDFRKNARGKHFLSDKVEHFTESVIREMTRQAMLHGAVNLAQGFPDFSGSGRNQASCAGGHRRRRESIRHHLGREESAQRHRPADEASGRASTSIPKKRSRFAAARPKP